MKSRKALVSILVLLLALLLVFTSVAWADGLQPPLPSCFRIEGTSKWVKPWPYQPDDYGNVETRIKAEGTVTGVAPFEDGRFTFMEWATGNLVTQQGETEGVLTIKPGPPGGKVIIYFEGDSHPGIDPLLGPYLIVEGKWETLRANGHYQDYNGAGSFNGIVDLCYPDYDNCPPFPGIDVYPGFYVDFCP